jgi:diguanylate cyclase (GGDEF)-like protein
MAYLEKTPSDPEAAYEYILLSEKYINRVREPGYEILFLVKKAGILIALERYKEAGELINKAEKIIHEQPKNIEIYSTIDILQLRSELFYNQKLFRSAYQLQLKYYAKTLEINKFHNSKALDNIRILYENEQHEIKSRILAKKRLLQTLALKAANEKHRENTLYIIACIVITLVFIWFYILNLRNQRKLIDRRATDYLTDLPNRQSILSIGASRYNEGGKREFSVLIIKIDNLTNINKVKSYEVGNKILIEVSQIITMLIGEHANCGRYSSNEFIVFLSDVNARKAKYTANEIHNVIYGKSWGKYGLKVLSVSIGLSSNTEHIDSYDALIKAAKSSKQQAVIAGGNTVCI